MTKTFISSAALFFATLFVARMQGWQGTDIAWSMWLASLVIGYAFIVFVIFVANPTARELAAAKSNSMGLNAVRAAGFGIGLFTLAFFTFHFGMFHAVHAVFLQSFFPLDALAASGSSMSFNILTYLIAALREYWPFVIAAGLSQARLFVSAYRGKAKTGLMAPYAAVVKNHLVIIALGFLTIAAPTFNVTAFLLLVYFFPWGDAFTLINRKSGAKSEG